MMHCLIYLLVNVTKHNLSEFYLQLYHNGTLKITKVISHYGLKLNLLLILIHVLMDIDKQFCMQKYKFNTQNNVNS